MSSLVGEHKSKEKSCKRHMIEASLEFGLQFGHSNFDFLNGAKSTNWVFSLNPNGPKMHRNIM